MKTHRTNPRLAGAFQLLVAWVVTALPGTALARVVPGIEAGLSRTTLDYRRELPPWDVGWGTRIHGGLTLTIPFDRRLAFATGLRYAQRGHRVEYDTGPDVIRQVGEFSIVQDYLAVPLAIEFQPLPSRRFSMTIGPELAFVLAGRLKGDETVYIGSSVEHRTRDFSIRDELDPIDVTLNFGAAIEFPLAGHYGRMGIRYAHGVAGVADEDAWFSDWSTRSLDWVLGVRW